MQNKGPPPKVACPRQPSSFLEMPYLRGGKKVDKAKRKKRKRKKTYSETGLPIYCHQLRIVHLECGTPPRCVIWDQVSPFYDLWVVQSWFIWFIAWRDTQRPGCEKHKDNMPGNHENRMWALFFSYLERILIKMSNRSSPRLLFVLYCEAS